MKLRDHEEGARELKTSRTVFNSFFAFRTFAQFSMPVNSLVWLLAVFALATLAVSVLAAERTTTLLWPAALWDLSFVAGPLLVNLTTSVLLTCLIYWLGGAIFALPATFSDVNITPQTVRQLLLFAGIPLYICGIVGGFWISILASMYSDALGHNANTFSVEGPVHTLVQIYGPLYAVVMWLSLAESVRRFYVGYRVLAPGSIHSWLFGLVVPIVLLCITLALFLLPSPLTERMANNLERESHRATMMDLPGIETILVNKALYVVPEVDSKNYLRFYPRSQEFFVRSFMDNGEAGLRMLDSLLQMVPQDSRAANQMRAQLGWRRGDYDSVAAAYENLIGIDSTDDFHRRSLVSLLLDQSYTTFDPEKALPHALKLRRRTDYRTDELLFGVCRYHVGDYRQAYAILHPLMMQDQRDSPTLFYLALTCMELKRYKMARRLLDMSINNDPRHQNWIINYGRSINAIKDSIQTLIDADKPGAETAG